MKAQTGLTKNSGENRVTGIFLLLSIMFFLLSCGTSKNTGHAMEIGNYHQLAEVVDSGQFAIENSWAVPLGGNQIDLVGNPNFIRFEGDSVDVFLPYFGVRHSGGTYGSGEGAIVYEGPLKRFSASKNEEKSIILKFEGDHNTENLDFTVTLYPSGKTHTSVNSSQRHSISYRGELRELPADQVN